MGCTMFLISMFGLVACTSNVDEEKSEPQFDDSGSVFENDPPVFTSAYEFTVPENQIQIGTVTATDSNGDTVSFSIAGDNLLIEDETGILTFDIPPDYETKNVFSAVVTVSDGTDTTTQDIVVNITNENEYPPVFVSVGSFIVDTSDRAVGTLLATDDDADSIRYSLEGVDANVLYVDEFTGDLQLVAPADYRQKEMYVATAVAFDGVHQVEQVIDITVNPLSEGQVYLSVGGETGSVDSGLPVPLVESYSFNQSSSVDDSNGNPFQASALHSITAEEVSWSREGDYVLDFYADGRNFGSAQDYSRRVELATSPTAIGFSPGEERFYSMSFLAPKSVWDQPTLYSTVIAQWKQYGGGNPNAEIRLSNMGDYKLTARSVRHWDSEDDEGDFIGTVIPDVWNDLKMYVKHSEYSDGTIQIWLNGESIFEYHGSTLYKDEDGYIKFGMYTEIRDERTLYFDAIRISNFTNETLDEWASDQSHIPIVAITNPADGLNPEAGTELLFSAEAVDIQGENFGTVGGIAQVEFYDGSDFLGVDTTRPYEIAWNPSEGQHVLTVDAVDTDGNTVTSTSQTIFVGAFPPTVTLTSPNALDNYATGDTIAFGADATDQDGQIVRVEFFVNEQSIGVDEQAPYEMDWIATESGAFTLKAVAVDSDSKSTESELVTITVDAVIETSETTALEDASLRESASSSTSNWSNVEVYGKQGGQIIGIFKFDLTEYISAPEVRDAVLKLYTHSVDSTPTSITVFRSLDDSWTEDTVTWSNGPTKGSPLTSVSVSNVDQYYEFDVTEYVADKVLAGDSTVTFWLEDEALIQQPVEFESHTRDHPPLLEVTTSSIAAQ